MPEKRRKLMHAWASYCSTQENNSLSPSKDMPLDLSPVLKISKPKMKPLKNGKKRA
jgi:hypothetical protein